MQLLLVLYILLAYGRKPGWATDIEGLGAYHEVIVRVLGGFHLLGSVIQLLCYSAGFGSLNYQLLRDERERELEAEERNGGNEREDSTDATVKLAEAAAREFALTLGPDAPGVPKLRKKKEKKGVQSDQMTSDTSDDDSDMEDKNAARKAPGSGCFKRLKGGLGGKIPGIKNADEDDEDDDEDEDEEESLEIHKQGSFLALVWSQANSHAHVYACTHTAYLTVGLHAAVRVGSLAADPGDVVRCNLINVRDN